VHAAGKRFEAAEQALKEALTLVLADSELKLSMRPAILRALADAQAQRGDYEVAYTTLSQHHDAHNEFMAYRVKNTKLTLAAQAEIRRLTSERDQARKLQQLSEMHAAQLQQQLTQIERLQQQVGGDLAAE
jgi:hypothetical protein